MQYAFATIAILMIGVLAVRCFFVKQSKIDEGNSDIYGKDRISLDDVHQIMAMKMDSCISKNKLNSIIDDDMGEK